jgi:hypothetical protein
LERGLQSLGREDAAGWHGVHLYELVFVAAPATIRRIYGIRNHNLLARVQRSEGGERRSDRVVPADREDDIVGAHRHSV